MNGSEDARAPGAGGRRAEWLLLGVLAAVQFVHVLDFVIIMPLGPMLMRSLQVTPRQFGLVVSAYTFAAAAGGLMAALWMDRFDRKRALLVLLGGFTLGTFLCALAPDYPMLLAARVVAGTFGGVLVAVVFAVIGDQVPAERRGTAMGIVMSGFSVASVVGLPLGLWVAARMDWHAPFFLLAGMSLVVMAVAAAALPPMRGHVGARPASAVRELAAVLAAPAHRRAFALSVALICAGFTIVPFISPYLVANVGLAETDLSYVYLAGGLATIVASPLAGRLADRFGQRRVLGFVVAFSVVPVMALTLLPPVPLWTALVVTSLLMVVGAGRMVPGMALITGAVEPRQRGAFMSVNSAVQQASAGVATFVAGLLIVEGPGGTLQRYPLVGLVAAAAALACIPLSGRLVAGRATGSAPAPAVAVTGPAAAPDGYRAASHR
jgi:predicted MFS family arabinose efflux permease